MASHRYAHGLYPLSGDRQPARFLALAADIATVTVAGKQRERTARLKRWALQAWTCEVGKSGRVRCEQGRSVSRLWDHLTPPLHFPGLTWLVACPAVQLCTLLGVWQRLDEGTLRWREAPAQEGKAAGGKGRPHGSGLCLLDDPPTAIDLGVPGLPGTLRIVDIRNYGLDAPLPALGARDRANLIGEAIRTIVSELARRGLGSLQVTASAQALYTFRRKHVSHNISVHCREPVLRLERASLHGGRSECYRLGTLDGPVYHLDFSSHYGAICRDTALPVRLRYHGSGDSLLLRRELSGRQGIVAECRVATELPYLPCRKEGLTVYPVGRFWSTLAGPDLYTAHWRGEILGFGAWATYDLECAFQTFATECLEIRANRVGEGAGPLSYWAKQLMVGLVGKFAQSGYSWEDTGQADDEERWWQRTYYPALGDPVLLRCLGGRVQKQVRHTESANSCPALASYVYAEGRRRLFEAQLVAGRENVYYSHTDSLFLSKKGFDSLKEAGLLERGGPGELRLVQVCDWIQIFGLNHYLIPGRYVCGGRVPPGSSGHTAGEIAWRRRTARECLVRGSAPLPVEVAEHYERASPYRHGLRCEDGRIEPWRINDGR